MILLHDVLQFWLQGETLSTEVLVTVEPVEAFDS